MKDLWVEKYRPSGIDSYVFRDDKQRQQVSGWVNEGALPTYCLVVHLVLEKLH